MANTASPWIVDATDENFEREVFERSRELTVVVDFWAAWCGPCRLLGPVIEKLAVEFDGKFLLVKANTDEVPRWANEFNVDSIPILFAVKGGQVVNYFQGVQEPLVRRWLDSLQPTPAELLLGEARQLASTDPKAAEAKYREALALAPDDAIQIELGELLVSQGRFSDVAVIIGELESRGYLEPEAEKLKAQLTLQQDSKASGGVEPCRAALAANPSDFALQWNLAEALAAAKQYEESLKMSLKLVQLDRAGQGEKARHLMVDIFRILGDDNDLVTTFRRKLSMALT